MGAFASSAALWLLLLAQQAEPGQCGFDRWKVKILADGDAGRVTFAPEATTISKLAALKIHEVPYPHDARLSPEELKTYRVRARFVRIRRESDKDLHIIAADPDNDAVRIIAEIPAPECVKTRADEYRRAREVAAGLRAGQIVEIVGVGFFDFVHTQIGGAKNGFELHPVLSLKIVD